MLKQFKNFLLKTDIIDLAVAVTIGAAFGQIVSSIVDDIVTPLLMTPFLEAAGITDIKELTWGMIRYGTFAAAIIEFIIIGYVLFVIVKLINRIRSEEPKSKQGV